MLVRGRRGHRVKRREFITLLGGAVAGEKGLTSRLGLQKGLLPIDAKFPHDSFERVVAAAEAGNPAEDFLLAPKFT